MAGDRSPTSIAFGDYRLNLSSFELRKNGLKVRLQQQPARVLVALAGKSGEVVTREEIQRELWKDHTFVDFESGLNNCIKQIRAALNDDTQKPKYVETLPRVGYRFLAPVEMESRVPIQTTISGVPARRKERSRRNLATALAVAIVLALLAGFGVDSVRNRLLERFSARSIRSLAILPLTSLSADPEEDYFADGMTEQLITDLGQIRSLRVISRTSVVQFKGSKEPLSQIGKRLGVDAVVEGTVTRSGNHVRITANLVQVSPERHLWAESYETDFGDILTLQGKMAQGIATAIRVKLAPEERTRLASTHSVSPEAYEDYLRGLYFSDKSSTEGIRKGIKYFQQAIEKDSGYAEAYTGLADCYIGLAAGMGSLRPQEYFPRAQEAATRALAIDDTLAEAHKVLGSVKLEYDWDWASAEREFRRAIELNPNSADVHGGYANYLQVMGRFNESLVEGRRAQELVPLSQSFAGSLGYTFSAAGRYDEAISQFKKAIELDPSVPWLHAQLAWDYARKGMYEEAIAEYERIGERAYAVSEDDQVIAAGLGWVYALAGKRNQAHQILIAFHNLASRSYVDFYMVGVIYGGLGDKDRAFQELEKGYAEHSTSMVFLKSDPYWDDNFRADPRYSNLLRRMSLPE